MTITQTFEQIGDKSWAEVALAIGELLSLTRTIRESSISNRDVPVPDHYQRPDTRTFEQTCQVLVRNRFPDARSTLTDQLSKAITIRRNRLLYRRDHEAKMHLLEVSKVSVPEIRPGVAQIDDMSLSSKCKHNRVIEDHASPTRREALDTRQPTPTLLSRPGKSLAQRSNHQRPTPSSIIGRSSRFEGDVKDMYPEKPLADRDDNSYGTCPYCFSPQLLPVSDEQWRYCWLRSAVAVPPLTLFLEPTLIRILRYMSASLSNVLTP